MTRYIFLALMVFSCGTQAEGTDALTVDRSVPNNIELSFPNDNSIKPKSGDFEIVNYVLMSNEAGERWGL